MGYYWKTKPSSYSIDEKKIPSQRHRKDLQQFVEENSSKLKTHIQIQEVYRIANRKDQKRISLQSIIVKHYIYRMKKSIESCFIPSIHPSIQPTNQPTNQENNQASVTCKVISSA